MGDTKTRKKSDKTAGSKTAAAKIPAKLAGSLVARMRASLLPGETDTDGEHLEQAARFLLETGLEREPGRSAIALASASEEHRYMRIAIVNDDMPFLVDSIAATIAANGLSIDRLLHPVVAVRRDASCKLVAIDKNNGDDLLESMIYIETGRVDARHRRAMEAAIRTTLADVRAAVVDWPKLQEVMLRDAEASTDEEGRALLEWLNSGMLTQLGHVTYARDGSRSEALGVCRKSAKDILAPASIARAFAWFDGKGSDQRQPLIVKANVISNVHRRVPLDLFIMPQMADGEVVALSIHAGVWTSAALAAPPISVPRLRRQLDDLFDRRGFDPNGHAGKALVHAMTTLPHDLVIGFSDADVERVASALMGLVDRPRPRVALVEAPLARHIFAFVWLPRDMLSTQVREQVQDLIEDATGATLLDWSVQVEGGNLAMMRFVYDSRETGSLPDGKDLDERLQTLLRGWAEGVESELARDEDPNRAAAIAGRYAEAFPPSFRAAQGAAEAARDIRRLRALGAHDDADGGSAEPHRRRGARLYRAEGMSNGCLRLKVYQETGSLALSDAVPALENFGFEVISEIPTSLEGGSLGTIHDFTVELPEGIDADAVLDRAGAVEAAISAVLNGEAEDDDFNRLVVANGLAACEAVWLRSFYRYLRQTGMGFTIYTVVDALQGAPKVTAGIVALFKALHDPDFSGNREEEAESAREAIRRALVQVNAINDDRLLRLYHSLVEAILRTNAFAAASDEALAYKIDSSLVPGLPKPVPWREIWVYSRRVEGIHLRAGPIARGGLRWSDRRDDFRTEILGLMKAQRVKNAVIVPTGAKGGFYPKLLPSPAKDRAGWAAEGQASYEVFIRSLLSITDNIVADKVVHPERVVRRDGDDPYFVVAADKGTARFSDVANAIAESRDFWLDDAFASGGSNGYDHKAMGITAKGAWVSVQRHFLEMGVDVQTDPVRVVGCGDMSGDVFGNGMLLSKAIKLVAAFDHRHIFIDPDPDAAASWKERNRLFDLPSSSWDDYDRDAMSRGGGIWSRSEKKIKLSKAAQAALGIEVDELEPDEVISAILKAPIDLVWFGGIGTYIKATSETNAQVGDPANDALRVNAEDVRAKVIGEGANLGVTQAGRIEFALEGGRINTDFIDNSAGVDCSDNEVNIKIALAAAKRAGKLSEKARNALLKDMTDEVADIVLEDNRLQALALSIAELRGPGATDSYLRLIETLETQADLDRRTEGLADNETFARRANDGQGLTRPELAVLLSSAKLRLQDAIENSDLASDPSLRQTLLEAFPEPMRVKFRQQILNHRLRTELVATKLANRMVNRLGIIHAFELVEEEGVDLAEVAAAFVTVDQLFGLDELWSELDTAKITETARLRLFDTVAAATGNLISDVLRTASGHIEPSAMVKDIGKPVATLAASTDQLLANQSRRQSRELGESLVAAGAPDKLAARIVHLFDLDGSVGLAKLSRETGIAPKPLTQGFTDVGETLGLDWAQSTAALMSPSDVWERLLVSGLARDFQQMRLDLLRRLARRKDARKDMPGVVAKWSEDNALAISRFRMVIARAQRQTAVAPAMLAQIASMARNLLAR
ncbi:NAD-glutamate dehydrogenase domain-containing protein [Qipengyuania oceanensis]|uniref:Glutamate dehydrogenase n=1 Tax=Qipengyuania oceanensis TaxID=1463597 RepID=A0A844YIR7_9SPHN|nr:glutamate dehydrogenase [Qipengyuania oceanensis]